MDDNQCVDLCVCVALDRQIDDSNRLIDIWPLFFSFQEKLPKPSEWGKKLLIQFPCDASGNSWILAC